MDLVSPADYGLEPRDFYESDDPARWADADYLVDHARRAPSFATVRARLLWQDHGLTIGERGGVYLTPDAFVQSGDVVTAYDGVVVDAPTLNDLRKKFPRPVIDARRLEWPSGSATTIGALWPIASRPVVDRALGYYRRPELVRAAYDLKPKWRRLLGVLPAPDVLADQAAGDRRGLGAYARTGPAANAAPGFLVSREYVARKRYAVRNVRYLIDRGVPDDDATIRELLQEHGVNRVRDIEEPWLSFLPVVVATRDLAAGEELVLPPAGR